LIRGLGTDIVELARFKEVLARRGERILARLFTPEERRACGDAPHRLAARFAAKEALLKALGTGLRQVSWQEMSILPDALGAPRFHCTGRVRQALAIMEVSQVHVSLAHSRHYAVAQVILEG
jgi:holo-[acyl-carrier protein] synthase